MWKFLTAAVITAAGATASAQEVTFSIDATLECLANMSEFQNPRSCFGSSANACMEATPGGWSTVGMGGCLNKEYEYWDARLNKAYVKVRDMRRDSDKGLRDVVPNAPLRAPALLEMQRAWIAFRDATCTYERAHWEGGTGGGPATLSCLLTMTAEQTLFLEADAIVE